MATCITVTLRSRRMKIYEEVITYTDAKGKESQTVAETYPSF